MSDHKIRTIERHCDVAVIGGSAAGLAAALQLGRLRRSVIVIDAGTPRNAPADHMHGYLGHDGIAPSDFTAIAREDVRRYGTEVLAGRVTGVTRDGAGFRLTLTGHHAVQARRVLVATGIVDELPEVDGLNEHWGRGVIHCPFCHGYEVRDRRLVQIVSHPMHLHPAVLFARLSDRLTLVLHDVVGPDDHEVEALRASGVRVIDARARRVVTDDGCVVALELDGGARIDADAVVVGTRFRPRVDALDGLGVALGDHPSGLGQTIETSPTGATSVDGVYAAGNVVDPSQQVLHAAANGSWVGAMIGVDLARDDLALRARSSEAARIATANQTDWDHRYGEEPIWSGNPNGSLVAELTGTTPGTALDVGAGEGGDAVWMSQNGWKVTANDISQRAVDRIDAIAAERKLAITGSRADANDPDPFDGERFDLVTAHYASIPRTHDDRGIANLLAAVAPGGTLLVVGHDLEPMRRPVDTAEHSRPFDPDAYVRVDDVAATIASSSDWHVDVHETRPRPTGHTAASHHVDDVILRARRLAD